MLERSILIAIPTYNRSAIVEHLLIQISGIINATPNIYLGLYDSSDNNDTQTVVEPFLSDSIRYKRYDAGLSEEKGYDILCNEGTKYDYIWFCSDRKVLRLGYLLPVIESDINSDADLIFFSCFGIEGSKKTITKRYEMGIQFFEVLNLAKSIIRSNVVMHMAKEDVYSKFIGSHFSIQASLMDYIGCYDFKAVQFNLRDQDVAVTGTIPFKHEWGDNVVWQWSKSWCDTVDKLPSSFNDYKEEIIRRNYMFTFRKVLARRATGNEYVVSDIKEYERYIKRITTSLVPFYVARAIPTFALKYPYILYKKIKTITADNQ